MKFDSGTGWPSFFTTIPGAFATTTDRKLFMERTEYHCVRCGGHHGHIFDDGPEPTGLRYCNNGEVLRFIPKGPGQETARTPPSESGGRPPPPPPQSASPKVGNRRSPPRSRGVVSWSA